jgi:hypothetical protein
MDCLRVKKLNMFEKSGGSINIMSEFVKGLIWLFPLMDVLVYEALKDDLPAESLPKEFRPADPFNDPLLGEAAMVIESLADALLDAFDPFLSSPLKLSQ